MQLLRAQTREVGGRRGARGAAGQSRGAPAGSPAVALSSTQAQGSTLRRARARPSGQVAGRRCARHGRGQRALRPAWPGKHRPSGAAAARNCGPKPASRGRSARPTGAGPGPTPRGLRREGPCPQGPRRADDTTCCPGQAQKWRLLRPPWSCRHHEPLGLGAQLGQTASAPCGGAPGAAGP